MCRRPNTPVGWRSTADSGVAGCAVEGVATVQDGRDSISSLHDVATMHVAVVRWPAGAVWACNGAACCAAKGVDTGQEARLLLC